MHINDLIKSNFLQKQNDGLQSGELVAGILDLWSEAKDSKADRLLIRQLVLSYASSEKKLAELNQLKNRFLGIAAHDLRNPLSSIMGFSELFLEEAFGPLTKEQKEYMQIINTTSNQMLSMVNDLLDVAVIESGKLDLVRQEGNLEQVLKERVRIIKPVAEKKNILLNEQYAGSGKTSFDPGKIAQVVDNLISNAVKFSPPDKNVFITLDTKTKGNMVRVSVRDEGPGLSEEDQVKLFGDFQKLSARPTGGEKSTGLGLSIVKKIIEAHNGTLQVESAPGAGATFSFLIPLKG